MKIFSIDMAAHKIKEYYVIIICFITYAISSPSYGQYISKDY
jgi:hypothetical protein